MTLAQLAQSGTQVKAQHARQGHREVGVAVRVYGELGGLDPLLAHAPVDRRAAVDGNFPID
jgi:hypothetical protein